MSASLSDQQIGALRALAETEKQSGQFYSDRGVHSNTLIGLEAKGLALGHGDWDVRSATWEITDNGRSLLASLGYRPSSVEPK